MEKVSRPEGFLPGGDFFLLYWALFGDIALNDCLFVYGTLHPDRAPAEIAEVVRGFRQIGRGSVRGKLFDLGEYPGVVLDGGGGVVNGVVFTLPDGVLARLDAYEGGSFERERVRVEMADGSRRECWMYVWNGMKA